MKLLEVGKDYLNRTIIDQLKRFERLNTPIDIIIKTLQHFETFPKEVRALELFGKYGLWITKDYAKYCDYLEIWEIDPYCAKWAQRFFPEAVVVCGDSIRATQSQGLKSKGYNFIVIDNNVLPFCEGYFEHFDIIPYIINYLDDNFVLIINVVGNIDTYADRTTKRKEWLRKRMEFYGVESEQEAANIPVNN